MAGPFMTIQVAVLCDAAADYNGKLSLLGTFDTIFSPVIPTQHPQCAVAVRIGFERMEEGPHTLEVSFVDEDGHPIMREMKLPGEVVFPPEATFASRNFIVNIQQMVFAKEGLYSVNLAMDGNALCSIPLVVKRIEPVKS
jgi:hypothetical protein